MLSIEKAETSNAVTITYTLSPTVSALAAVDWATTVQQQSTLNAQITAVVYDSASGQLKVTMSYAENLEGKTLALSLALPPAAPFDKLPPTTSTVTLTASNNLSLDAYPAEEYTLATVFEYVAAGASLLALGFFFMGLFSGKIIALEMLAVFQVTYFSLLSLENLRPTFSALRFLSFSCGFSLKVLPTVWAHRRFTGIGLQFPFLNNFNLAVVLLAVPLLLSGALALANRCRYKGTHAKLILWSQLLRGEFIFYALMFAAYLFVVSAGITAQRTEFLAGIFLVGAGLNGALILLLVVYAILLGRRVLSFGEYV